MERITYSLREQCQIYSDQYYDCISTFTDEVLTEARNRLTPIIQIAHNHQDQENNSQVETILELLILGTLSDVYLKEALNINGMQYRMLKWVTEMRQKYKQLKPAMSYLKGILSKQFLSYHTELSSMTPIQNMSQLHKLIRWLEATGEFGSEVKRLKAWERYLKTLPYKDTLIMLETILSFARWFERRSEEILGQYTAYVNQYLHKSKNKYNRREDIIFCNRRRVEYHLNMVGAEIMNRVFREDFLKTHKRILLLPICMTSPRYLKCQSEGFGKDFKCKACSKECMVNQLTKLEKGLNFRVMVVLHESSISAYNRKDTLFDSHTGVIGVACILNLISGGWMLKDMGIPAQCVPLDYCGCKKHWHDKGIPTCINFKKLQEINKVLSASTNTR
ncbi:DUF116 domain-containing protein [Geosporobacter ferrireducens]|uniref:DUF116 domain-containing protein n=1 Tax=Geosporobacter ferrireducens TaxID=1424294 RepID=UPI00139CC027|nr:DUF116 domain-containing protein [Geosporobacter ferrireducens]MTI56284.1 DUF116 domain-containing protein [Geosporobacter ferrireducens]